MYTNHSAMKYLVIQPIFWGDICQWILLFQEFYFEIIIKLGRLDSGLGHLSRIESGEEPGNLDDSLPDAQMFVIKMFDDHYRDIIHLLTKGYAPEGFSIAQKKQLVVKSRDFQLIVG